MCAAVAQETSEFPHLKLFLHHTKTSALDMTQVEGGGQSLHLLQEAKPLYIWNPSDS